MQSRRYTFHISHFWSSKKLQFMHQSAAFYGFYSERIEEQKHINKES